MMTPPATPSVSAAQAAPAPPEATDALKVLVVDDTATNRHLLQVFLKKLGFRVYLAVDGAQAVERFLADAPDLVLMDVMMPVMDGYEATRRIKQLCGDRWVPVVFLSALDKEENLVIGLDAGGDDYLHKPVSFTVLDAKLRSLKRSILLQRTLDETRRRTQAIADNVIDGIVTIDERGLIQSMNTSALRMFGYTAEEIVGQNVARLMPEPHHGRHDEYIERYLETNSTRVLGKGGRDVSAVRKNGTVFPLDLGVTELRFEGRRLFVGITRDVTEQRAAERLLHENAARLQRYHDAQEAENILAQQIMEQQLRRAGLADGALQHWIAPAAHFSGDVIAAERAADGRLYVLLADATGHGLAAAVSVLPMLTVFYGQIEQGRPLDVLVMELNRHLRATMPPGRFVAANLICVDEARRRVQFWQGGMPDILLLSQDGSPARAFPAQHVPLGIVDFDADMTRVTEIEFAPGQQLVTFSDGLIEAASRAGEAYGQARLLEVLASTAPAQRFEAVRASLYAHTGIVQSHDDISLLFVSHNPR